MTSDRPTGPWLDTTGTSIVGFGILRLVPRGGERTTFHIRYRESAMGYGAADDFQLFVLPGDAFAVRENVFAGDFLTFSRSDVATRGDPVVTHVSVAAETTVLVAYGPWTAPDTGRPPGDVPTFSLAVTAPAGAAFEWIESEAGELITTNWSRRPSVTRGESVEDPATGARLFLEVRPLILYDARLVRATGEPAKALAGDGGLDAQLAVPASDAASADLAERLEDQMAAAARSDRRITMTARLAEKFRRVPIRWR